MVTKNLVINDWVYSALEGKNIQLDLETLYTILSGYDDGIEPIPLTAEILELFDFEQVSDDKFINDRFSIVIRERDNSYYIWDHFCVESVDELQHILRCNHYYNLADNTILK